MSLVIGHAENHGGHPEPGRHAARPAGKRTPPQPVGHGPGNMPRTIQCNHCGVVLNVPDGAEGRRLKCPKCGVKFAIGSGGVGVDPSAAGPSPKDAGKDKSAGSTVLLSQKAS